MAIFDDSAIGTAAADHFDPADFDELIAAHGAPALWRRAIRCSCVNPETGHSQVDCPFCQFGLGVIWEDAEEIIVQVLGRATRFQVTPPGEYSIGDVWITFQSTVTPGHADRIDLQVGEMVIGDELFVRGAVSKQGLPTERLRFDPVSLEYGSALVSGVRVKYAPQEHFFVDADGTINWTSGPPDGTQYTVRYTARPAYICWNPQSRDEASVRMPYRCQAKRLDLFQKRVVEL